MNVSIITCTYNSAATIAETVNSVYKQTFPDIEHIIVDGASNDNTLEIINSIPNRITKIVSEPDNGIYDAMNKGIALATGDIVGILNSDDLYFDNNVIAKVIAQFEQSGCDSLYGDLFYVRKENINIIIRHWHTKPFVPGSFKKGWHPPHPTFFVIRDIYEKYGNFELQFKLAADFEIMLRFLEKYKISAYYLKETLVKMRLGGASNKNLKNIYLQNIECLKAFRLNGLKVNPILYPSFRILPKLLQFKK